MPMTKFFVTFFSPGTWVAEETTVPIAAWDVATATQMAAGITERYGARPYAFQFTTRSRTDEELDSRVTATSGLYFIDCTVRTLADVEAVNDPAERTLLSNMRSNGWDRVATPRSGWKFTRPVGPEDVVL